jgi:hypothetical protein
MEANIKPAEFSGQLKSPETLRQIDCIPPTRESTDAVLESEVDSAPRNLTPVVKYKFGPILQSIKVNKILLRLEGLGFLLDFNTTWTTTGVQQYYLEALMLIEQSGFTTLAQGNLTVEGQEISVSTIDQSSKQQLPRNDSRHAEMSNEQDALADTIISQDSHQLDYYIVVQGSKSLLSPCCLRELLAIISIYDPEYRMVVAVLDLSWVVFRLKPRSCLLQLLRIGIISVGEVILKLGLPSDQLKWFLTTKKESLLKQPLLLFNSCSQVYCNINYGNLEPSNPVNSIRINPPASWTPKRAKSSSFEVSLQTGDLSQSSSSDYQFNLELNPNLQYFANWDLVQSLKFVVQTTVIPALSNNLRVESAVPNHTAVENDPVEAGLGRTERIREGRSSENSDSDVPDSRFSEPFLDFSRSSQSGPERIEPQRIPPQLHRNRLPRGMKIMVEQKIVTTIKLINAEGVSYRQVLEEDNMWEFKL